MRGPKRQKSRRLLSVLVGLGAALAIAAVAVYLVLRNAEPILRACIVAALEQRFQSRVQLDQFHISLVKGLEAEGKGLRIWPPKQASGGSATDDSLPGQPLVRLDKFSFRAPLHFRPGEEIHIRVVELNGLTVDVPPKSHFMKAVTTAPAAEIHNSQADAGSGVPASAAWFKFRVDSIDCKEAHLVLETSKPGKLPLRFEIARLRLKGISMDRAITFEAELTNPRPPGVIHTSGTLGPMRMDDPGESPVGGKYRFDHADLGSFKGIAGILSSTGSFMGTLRDIAVEGEADVPRFSLTSAGHPMPLLTRFQARVDGTNGDTHLDSTEATLGQSHFTVSGEIVRVPVKEAAAGEKPSPLSGHEIALAVRIDRGRIEDFLQLATPSDVPLLTGPLALEGKLDIPPGTAKVEERMRFKGSFYLPDAQFTSAKIQDRVDELSRRGQGKPKSANQPGVADSRSQMQGAFRISGGVIRFSELKYTVPGAQIELAGNYRLEGEALDFAGTARMEATVSKMVGGWKGWLLQPVDRFFKKDGAGTEIGIHVSGTRKDPQFGFGKGEEPAEQNSGNEIAK
jgi:hypothetical protein